MFTKEWWESRSEQAEFARAVRKIKYITQFTGKWNRSARVLEIQCGLGAMPQFMSDNGYNYKGTDNSETVSEFWEDTETLSVREPDSTGFDDQQFHLVCWFSMGDGRIEQDRVTNVLNEMARIGHGAIVLSPFDRLAVGKDTEFLAFMLRNGWNCSHCNAFDKFYLFHRE